MRIDRLRVKNFRGFVDREFTFAPGFNVFVGENGAGKTSALDAIAAGFIRMAAIGVDPALAWTANDPLRGVVRREMREVNGVVTIERQYPVELQWSAAADELFPDIVEGTGLSVEPPPSGTGSASERETYASPHLTHLFHELAQKVRRGVDVQLPVFAYYSTGRLWTAPAIEREDVAAPDSRLRGYEHWHSPNVQVRRWLTWFKTQELIRLQEGAAPPVFGAVRAAVAACVEHCTDIAWLARVGELVLTFDDGRRVPFRDLSDGQRSMCALVGDLAHRCAELNPQLGLAAATETPGVVLIDEIDLHLHPRWQRRVVDDLRRVFPRVQFFATTHSPFIIQSLRPGELIDLDGRDVGEYAQQPIEDIAEEVMGVEVPQRGERSRKMTEAAEEYYRALDAIPQASPEEVERLKRRLDELSAPFSDDPAFLAHLNVERVARGLPRLPLPKDSP